MQHLHPDVSIRWEWGVGALFLVREPSIGPFIPRPDCPSRLILRIGIGKSASHSIHAAGIEEKGGGERNWNWEWRTSAKLESLRIQSERSDPSLWTRTSAWVAQSFIFVYANQFPSHTAIMRGPAMASCVPLESLARFAPQHCHNVIWFVSHAPLQLVAYRPQFGMHADWSQRSCLYTPQQLTRIDSIAT